MALHGNILTFIIIVSGNLPVVVGVQLPGMIILIVFKVVYVEPLLLVDLVKVVFPCNFWHLVCIQVDPDESIDIKMNMDGKKAI